MNNQETHTNDDLKDLVRADLTAISGYKFTENNRYYVGSPLCLVALFPYARRLQIFVQQEGCLNPLPMLHTSQKPVTAVVP